MPVEWKYVINDSNYNDKQNLLRAEVQNYPLKPITVTALDNRNTQKQKNNLNKPTISVDGSDPLSIFAQNVYIDPLSNVAEKRNSNATLGTTATKESTKAASDLWIARRSAILRQFTTTEKLSIVTSCPSGNDTHTGTIADKVRCRLDELDNSNESAVVQHMRDLTQHEYVVKIEQLNVELVQAWTNNQRVRALQIAIQCAKLLSDTSVMQFYPSQFVLITDMLDNFGRLVYDRLHTKAATHPLPERFTPAMVSASARETCENWFYKIASIPELLPRLYVEISILQCYRFLSMDTFPTTLQRLTQSIRGIGDPLVSIYLRCYLCHVVMNLTTERAYLDTMLSDMVFTYHTIFTGRICAEIDRQRLDIVHYAALYQPALDWIMHALATQDSDIILDTIITQSQNKKNNGLLINTILIAFQPAQISLRALSLATIIANNFSDGIMRANVICSLGACVNECAPPVDQIVPVLTKIWTLVDTFTDNSEYISCAESWTQFICQHCSMVELNQIMGDIIGRMALNRLYDSHSAVLLSIAERLLTFTVDFNALLTMDNFLNFIDLFQKEAIRQDVCKRILLECRNRSPDRTAITDPLAINALMHNSRMLSDTVNEMIVEDERRHISQLISDFVYRVTYGRDIEQQLAFYVDARSACPNLDGVFVTLVHCVNRIAIDTRRNAPANSQRKTLAFTKACAAFCYITIPSIVAVATRMDLYLLSGQVALQNGCLGQADACFESALNIISELPRTVAANEHMAGIDADPQETGGLSPNSNEPYLVGYLCSFLATLLVVPDSPEQRVLYLPRKLLHCVEQYTWDATGGSSGVCAVYLAALDMVAVSTRDTYPYGIGNVVSNDQLYDGDPGFIAELNEIGSLVIEKLLTHLKRLGEAQQRRAQATLAVELFSRIALVGDVTCERLRSMAAKLWSLAMKSRDMLDEPKLVQILKKVNQLKDRVLDPDRHQALNKLTTMMNDYLQILPL